ncbi:hypothetical protein [uncultured Psychroserpens sp.]|uniref:hypothetical protein n=1 Tax=uncultured Psychroserpens sp. TaxID=255436 RepID=UPI00260AC574|nr:hypothetical protein [uncultured Psychroserpens sp.]
MNRLLFLIVTITFVSCGVTKRAVVPENLTTYSPELNNISNSEIGITLVSKEIGQNYNAIEITKEFKTKPGNLVKTIKVGDIFVNDHYTEKYDLYSNTADLTFGIAIPKNGNDNPLVYLTSFSGTGLSYKNTKKTIEYKKTSVPVKQKNYFKQEFIYNGRVGNGLKFIYREYVEDYARPAFTQDLQYDLSESKIIGFRGLRIEVLNATNTEIKYKVLNHFDR